MIKINQKQKAGDNSVNIQNIRIIIDSTEEISKKVLESVFGEFPQAVKDNIIQNQASFLQILIDKLKDFQINLTELKSVVNSPDFQYISKRALIWASRTSLTEMHENISSLLIQRINNDDYDLKRIVFNKAIEKIGELTNNQLKILALGHIFVQTQLQLDTIDQLLNFLEKIGYPSCEVKRHSEIEDLISIGCVRLLSHNAYTSLEYKYPILFTYDKSKYPKAYELLEKMETSPIMGMTLTPVGIVIACVYYEQISEHKVDAGKWII